MIKHILLLIVTLLFTSLTLAADITGSARVVDGDTVWINDTKIRLHGIDTPETKQTCKDQHGVSYKCGEAATEALSDLIGSQTVRCEGETYDRYKRLIGTCYTGKVNLNSEMVRLGWAVAYRKYSKDYVKVEEEAHNAKRGVWMGDFKMPWDWRRK